MAYSKDFLIKLYNQLLNVRMIEEKLVEIYALGKVPGHIHSGVGEEAAYVSPLATKKDGDYIKVTHRPIAAVNIAGITFNQIFAEILGKETGTAGGRGGVNHIAEISKGLMGTAGSLGVDTVVSIGAGISSKLLNNGKIVYSFYGDGTSSRGTTHEAMNMAAAWKLPVLFICDNNQYAISAHISSTCPVENPGADRASAYGMPSKIADGADALAIYEAAKELTDYIRAGNGPAVLEVKCYRWRGHYEGDKAAYRDNTIAEKERDNDCIKNLESYLLKKSVMTKDDMELLRKEIALELDSAVKYAENSAEPNPDEIFNGLFV